MVEWLYNVVLTKLARKKLTKIARDVAEHSSPATAKRVRKDLLGAAVKLENLPHSKPKLPGTEDLDYEVRYTKRRKYKIIFRILESLGLVRVLTIRHDAEDPDDVLNDIR